MIHKKQKERIAGSIKGPPKPPPPPPPKLRPPELGDYRSAASYSVAETVDLICDGPILGLVNKFGALLSPTQILQGIYLNDVPVQEPTMAGIQSSIIGLNLNDYNQKAYQFLEREPSEGFGVERSFSMKSEVYQRELLALSEKTNKEKNGVVTQPFFSSAFKAIADAIEAGELADSRGDGFEFPHHKRSGKFLFAKFIEELQDSEGSKTRTTNTYPLQFDLKNQTHDTYFIDKDLIVGNPIHVIKTEDEKCSIDLSFTPQNKKCMLVEGSSFFKGISEIEKTLISDNKKEKEMLKDVLFYSLEVEFNEQDFLENKLYTSTLEEFQNILCEIYNRENKLAQLFGDTSEWISPYICFSYTGLLEGFDSKIHKNVFKDKTEDDKIFLALASDLKDVGDLNPRSFKSLLYPALDHLGNWSGYVKGFYYIKLNEEFILDQNYDETNVDFYAELTKSSSINFIKENVRLSISKNGIEL